MAKMKLAKQQRVLSAIFLDAQKQQEDKGLVCSYYLVYTTTLRTLDGPQPRTGAGFFDLHHPTWSPAALEEAIALIEGQFPLWEKPQIVETIVTFVKECSA